MSNPQLDAYEAHLESENERQVLQVMAIIQDQPGITTKQIREQTGLAPGTVSARLQDLESEGLVFKTGVRKYGKRKYTTYQYQPDSVKQTELRKRYWEEKYRKDTKNYFQKWKEKLPQRAITILAEIIGLERA